MCGDPQPTIRPNYPTRPLRRQVFLPHVNAVKVRRHTEVRAVIHDQADALPQLRFQLASIVENLPGCSFLITVLQDLHPGVPKLNRGGEHGGGIRETSRVEDRIEPREWKEGSHRRLTEDFSSASYFIFFA